ncbi:MAG: hypothetical protein ACRC17_05700 [Culicoidibacterales bacterium]
MTRHQECFEMAKAMIDEFNMAVNMADCDLTFVQGRFADHFGIWCGEDNWGDVYLSEDLLVDNMYVDNFRDSKPFWRFVEWLEIYASGTNRKYTQELD